PKDSNIARAQIGPGFDLAGLAGNGRIVTGDVRAVPIGKYAEAALEKLGIWAAVSPKVAMTENVRAALTLVARGEAALGIVYATDAKAAPYGEGGRVFPRRFASADRLSGSVDDGRETGGISISHIPALPCGAGTVRKVRIHVFGEDIIVTRCSTNIALP